MLLDKEIASGVGKRQDNCHTILMLWIIALFNSQKNWKVMILLGSRVKSLKEDGTVWLPWEADSWVRVRLAGSRLTKSVLRIITYEREGKGREKNWQRRKLSCDGFSALALWNALKNTGRPCRKPLIGARGPGFLPPLDLWLVAAFPGKEHLFFSWGNSWRRLMAEDDLVCPLHC